MIKQPTIIYPNYKWNGSLTVKNKTDFIIWHHTDSGEVSALTIDGWHKNNGWVGIGYHFVIHQDGTIEAGRPHNCQGAHAYGINNRSVGITFVGRYNEPNNMPILQFNSGVQLTAWLIENCYPNANIIGHRDAIKYGGDPSSCPGMYFPFNDMKNKTLQLLEGVVILSYFIDVPENAWYKDDIEFLANKGITKGEDSDNGKIFRPNDNITRAETAVLISRALKLLGVK